MTTDSIFKQATTPTTSLTDAPGWTLGIEASGFVAGAITAVWWYPPLGATGAVGWRVYEGHVGEAGGLLASGAFGAYTPGQWNRVGITSLPVTGINFMVCVFTSSHGDYAFRAGGFPIDDGVIRAELGCFREAADGRPTLTSSLSYMVDFEFTYGAGPQELAVASTLAGLAATAAMTRRKNLSVAVSLNPLTVQATAERTKNLAATAQLGRLAVAAQANGGTNTAAYDVEVGQPHSPWAIDPPRSPWRIGEPR